MNKILKNILVITLVIILLLIIIWVLYPKNIGFIEKLNINGFEKTGGQYSQCLGIKLSKEINNITTFRCIGIPFGKITI